ncbi:MAG: neutral/alkaline non-lysosomal ceramidase N-terminal domain-containing protein [Acidobacteriota bacterium]|nr:neutral/alkaline non-lysosomal ceramidase N-terminal domain-containing protein [Acidobacteriota bacterium]
MLTAGFSKVSISPPIGAPLAGFAARQGMCEGIHDELFSRALVLENNGKTVAFVSLDVLAVSSEFTDRVRASIEQKTGIGRDAIMIASTHTHAGPVTIKTFFNPEGTLDNAYMDLLAEAIEKSVSEAWEKRFPARVGVGSGSVSGIGVNRRTPDKKPIDEEIGIIKVEDFHGKTRAVFINYACHPTVLGSNNLLATGDFPYFTVEKIEQEIGDGGFAMFVNGTQGNISMGHSSELSAIGIITPGRTFERAAELGYKLADATLEALSGIQTKENCKLGAAISTVNFPLKDLPEIEEARQDFRKAEEDLERVLQSEPATKVLMKAKSRALYASITNFYAHETAHLDGHLPVELQAFRIGDAAFLAVPAEVFVEIGLELKRRATHKTYIVGIANGYIAYFPTEAAYADGGYEVVSSKIAPESESVFYQEALRLEERLFTTFTEAVSVS